MGKLPEHLPDYLWAEIKDECDTPDVDLAWIWPHIRQHLVAVALLRDHWDRFCNNDGWLSSIGVDYDDYPEILEAAKLIEWREVTPDDMESAFAEDRGLYIGGMMWSLTPAGRSALNQSQEGGDNVG